MRKASSRVEDSKALNEAIHNSLKYILEIGIPACQLKADPDPSVMMFWIIWQVTLHLNKFQKELKSWQPELCFTLPFIIDPGCLPDYSWNSYFGFRGRWYGCRYRRVFSVSWG